MTRVDFERQPCQTKATSRTEPEPELNPKKYDWLNLNGSEALKIKFAKPEPKQKGYFKRFETLF